MELPAEVLKMKLKRLTCKDCNSRSKKGRPFCYVHRKAISLKDKVCEAVSIVKK